MPVLTPVALWKQNPRQLLISEFNFAALFNEQTQDVLNQSESNKAQNPSLLTLLNSIEERTAVLSTLSSQITALRNQLNLSGLTSENNAIQSRLTATNADINTITTARTNAENSTTLAETRIGGLTLDTKVQRANPLLTELVVLPKTNSRNLTVGANNAYNWSNYAGIRVRPQFGLLMENQTQGVNAGAVTPNTWQKRKLNTIKFMSIDGGVLAVDNVITLAAGNYILLGFCTAAGCASAKTRLQQLPSTTIGFGASAKIVSSGGNVGRTTNFVSPIYLAFSLSATTQISYDFFAPINHESLPSASQGRGAGLDAENFAQLFILSANPAL